MAITTEQAHAILSEAKTALESGRNMLESYVNNNWHPAAEAIRAGMETSERKLGEFLMELAAELEAHNPPQE